MQKIKEHFEEEAAQFDAIIRRLIPYYEQMLTALTDTLPFPNDQPISILDLGSGTGAVSLALLERYPNAQVTLLDLSPKMLAIARERIPQRNLKAVIESDFSEWSWDHPYDVVASSLALHHLPSDAEKASFYDQIHAHLTPGGAFVNADVVLASSEQTQLVYLEKWKSFMARSISREEIETEWIPRYNNEDLPTTLSFHLEALQKSGFREVDVYWKYYNFAVFGGLKH